MKTATELRIRQESERQDEYLNRRIEAFILEFSPKDPHKNAAFCMRLTELVRNAYSCAVDPYEKTMQKMIENQPSFRMPLQLYMAAATPEKAPE